MPSAVLASLASYCIGLARGLSGKRRYCACCESHVFTFFPYKGGSRFAPAIVRRADLVGSDLDNFACSHCGASDRDRHLFLYLRASGVAKRFTGARILHFAPESRVTALIQAADPGTYVKADLFPTEADIERVDMLDIPYPDAHFDMIIANHVLEHVPDDRKALAELYRVLKPGGQAILQTPYAAGREETEDEGDTALDGQQRLERFGQEDHVRLFGTDFFQRVTDAGFENRVATHESLLPDIEANSHGVNPREPFMLFEKPAAG